MVKRAARTSIRNAAKKSKSTTQLPVLFSESEISKLAAEVSGQSKVNNLVPLMAQYAKIEPYLTTTEDQEVEHKARLLTVSLYKCFQKILEENAAASVAKSEKKQLVAKWVDDKYKNFKQVLLRLIQHRLAFSSSLQLDALDIMLGLVRLEARISQEFPLQTYQDLCKSLLLSDCGNIGADEASDNFIILEFLERFQKYWDLQAYFFDNMLVDTLLSWSNLDSTEKAPVFGNYLTIIKDGLLYTSDTEKLMAAPTLVDIKLPKTAYKAHFRTRYQKCFLNMLRITELSPSKYKALLVILHKRIIPFMAVPAALMDFLTDAYDQEEDEVVPILTLNSLWELMKHYNLEYPDFYTKLYSLLTPGLLLTRYRSRFFRLCDLFLSSTHLAANLVASFIKKLARLSLTAPSSAVVIVIPFIYNLLKRHPTCMLLLQNETSDPDYRDTFDNEEKDPMKTGAMGSSLWEMETLMTHYHPNIATLAKIFGEPFRKPSYNLEDFLDWSYASLMESENTRKYKGMASLEYEEWSGLFPENHAADSTEAKKSYIEGWVL